MTKSKRPSLAEVMESSPQLIESKSNTPDLEAQSEDIRGRKPNKDSKRNKWVQMNVLVPESLRDELKLQALKQKKDMSDVVVAALNKQLGISN